MDDDGFTTSGSGPDSVGKAVALLLLGLVVSGYGAYDYVEQTEAVRNAVPVDATVVEVSVETDSSGGRRAGVDYEPQVRFTYEYQGSSYTGTNLFPGSITTDYDTRSAAEDALSGYAEGETVTAYVAPSDPDDAFLKNRTSNAPIFAGLIGAVIAIVGAYSAVDNYRDSSTDSEYEY